MARIEFTTDTSVAADRVLAAATEFSERRPQLWPMIAPQIYRLHERGDDWAVVTEGTAFMGGVWARERYDWSQSGVVRATCEASNIFQPGSVWELRAHPRTGGGSHIEILNHRRAKGLVGHLIGAMIQLQGPKFVGSAFQKTLDILTREDAATAAQA